MYTPTFIFTYLRNAPLSAAFLKEGRIYCEAASYKKRSLWTTQKSIPKDDRFLILKYIACMNRKGQKFNVESLMPRYACLLVRRSFSLSYTRLLQENLDSLLKSLPFNVSSFSTWLFLFPNVPIYILICPFYKKMKVNPFLFYILPDASLLSKFVCLCIYSFSFDIGGGGDGVYTCILLLNHIKPLTVLTK